MIAAISSKRKGICHRISDESTTAHRFKLFCHNLVAWLGDFDKVVLVMDNLSLHKNHETLEYLYKKNITVIFTPVASSILNPVEHFFAIMKRAWSQQIQSFSEAQLKRMNIIEEMKEFLKRFDKIDGPTISTSFLKEAKKIIDAPKK